MNRSIRIAAVGGLALAVAGLVAGPANAASTHASSHRYGGSGAAVFVQTDGLAGNAVVAYDRGPGGRLHAAGTYATGGKGGQLDGSVVDHTASQGSLTLDQAHHLLYAVNAGSNTVTVFATQGSRLHRLQVIGSGGNFPVSVTAYGSQVFVLNARDGGSVQGYLRVGGHLVRIPAWHRALGLDPKATPEFVSTPGQVSFTPNGSQLIVTTKANGNDVDVFNLDRFGTPSRHPVVNELANAVPFAIAFDAGNHLVIAEAGPSALQTFRVTRGGALVSIDTATTGQAATCWVVRGGSSLYASNAGSGTLSRFRDGGNGSLSDRGNTTTSGGTVDATISSNGRYLYSQAGAAGNVDEFAINGDGSLTSIGTLTVPGAVGGEGIAAS
jgi:6-phosphogluconolactonase (cycloisomerase 2 family)